MEISFAVDIFCQPDRVFPWIAEPQKAMLWQKGVKSGEILKETPEIVGTKFKEVLDENGNSIVLVGEITNYIQDKLISFHLESKIHKVDVSYSIDWTGSKSTFSMEATIRWKFPMNVIALFFGRNIRKGILEQAEAELLELKKLCEISESI